MAWAKPGDRHYKPARGGAASGAGLWGAATGVSWQQITKENRPSVERVKEGKLNAEEYRAKLAERRAKVLAVLDRALDDATAPGADVSAVQLGLRAADHIVDRLDGKPAQALVGDAKAAPIRLEVGWATDDGS